LSLPSKRPAIADPVALVGGVNHDPIRLMTWLIVTVVFFGMFSIS